MGRVKLGNISKEIGEKSKTTVPLEAVVVGGATNTPKETKPATIKKIKMLKEMINKLNKNISEIEDDIIEAKEIEKTVEYISTINSAGMFIEDKEKTLQKLKERLKDYQIELKKLNGKSQHNSKSVDKKKSKVGVTRKTGSKNKQVEASPSIISEELTNDKSIGGGFNVRFNVDEIAREFSNDFVNAKRYESINSREEEFREVARKIKEGQHYNRKINEGKASIQNEGENKVKSFEDDVKFDDKKTTGGINPVESETVIAPPVDASATEQVINNNLSEEEWKKIWEVDVQEFREASKVLMTIDKDDDPVAYKKLQEKADLLYHITLEDLVMKANALYSENFNKAMEERSRFIDKLNYLELNESVVAQAKKVGENSIRLENNETQAVEQTNKALQTVAVEPEIPASREEKHESDVDLKSITEEEWNGFWERDEKFFKEVENDLKQINKDTEPEKYKSYQEIADKLYHIVNLNKIMKANEFGGDVFISAMNERKQLVDDLNKLIIIPEAENIGDKMTGKDSEVQDKNLKNETVEGVKASKTGDEEEVVEAPEVGRSDAGEISADESDSERKDRPKSEAERLHAEDLSRLKEKQDILSYWENLQMVWQADYNAATKRFKDRSKRARCSYEILKAEALIVRARVEIEYLQKIADASGRMVAAKNEFGEDCDDYVKAQAERNRLLDLYKQTIQEVGEAKAEDDRKRGSLKRDQEADSEEKVIVKSAKMSKAKAFWQKIKKPALIFTAIATSVALISTGIVHGLKYINKDSKNDPSNVIENPEEKPDDGADQTEDNENVQDVEENVDTGTLTDEGKQVIGDYLLQGGLIASDVSVSGVEAISYRKDGDVEKANIYVSTAGGWVIEYQSQMTKDEIVELSKTEGVTTDDIISLIMEGVSNNNKADAYKQLDASQYSQIIDNVYSEAEDIEFPEPGTNGDYTKFYYKLDNSRNEKGDKGNIDFIVMGPNSVIKVDDRVEYETKTGEKLNLKDPSALLNALEKQLGGTADSSGYNGKITTSFDSESYFKRDIEELKQEIMNQEVKKTEQDIENLTR